MTSAITSSEMHLDSVSICQNKAASTASSLMAMDVRDRGGEERWWGGTCTFKEAQKIAAACITHTCTRTHEHTRTPCMRAHSNTKAAIPFLLAADLTNHLIQNFYRALLKAVELLMFVYVCLSVCNRIVCIFTFQQCSWLSDTFHHLSL